MRIAVTRWYRVVQNPAREEALLRAVPPKLLADSLGFAFCEAIKHPAVP